MLGWRREGDGAEWEVGLRGRVGDFGEEPERRSDFIQGGEIQGGGKPQGFAPHQELQPWGEENEGILSSQLMALIIVYKGTIKRSPL